MRLIFVILFLICLQSHGQIINASQPYRPQVASCSYMLDQYSSAAAAYSLRKLDCDYSGNAIRVRRSSDNTEQDIGFTANGHLDTTTLKSFTGSNSAYVTTWYDQSGNGLNVTQSTSGNQPRIVNAGVIELNGTKPSVLFIASSSTYLNGGDILDNDSTYLNIFSVAKFGSAATQTIITKSNADVSQNKYAMFKLSGSMYNWYIDAYTNRSAYSSFSETTIKLVENFSNKTVDSVQVLINGSQLAVNTASIGDAAWNTSYNFYIGAYNGSGGTGVTAGFYMDGYISEIVIFKKSVSRAGVRSNINSYYSIY